VGNGIAMRLTNKETKIKLSDTKRYDLQDHKMFTKLSELEDIEDKLGFGLVALFDGLNRSNSSICIIHNGGIINVPVGFGNINCGAIGKEKIKYFFDLDEGQYFLEDYGKTWAFTKKELVKEEQDYANVLGKKLTDSNIYGFYDLLDAVNACYGSSLDIRGEKARVSAFLEKLKNGVYYTDIKKAVYGKYININKSIKFARNPELKLSYGILKIDEFDSKLLIDYGKTWALTKEELLND
jgi:hypothetical protein